MGEKRLQLMFQTTLTENIILLSDVSADKALLAILV